MLDKMKASHFVKKYSVQFVSASGKLSEPFYFVDNKPHECSQTWQVRAQRVRQDDARQRPRARRRGARRRARARSAVRGRAGRRRAGRRTRTARERDGAGEGRRRRQRPEHDDRQNRFKLRVWDPVLKKGAHLDLLEGRLPRHGPRRGGDAGPADARARRAGSGTSRCTTTSSASASWRRSTTCSRAAADHETIYDEEVERCPGGQAAGRRAASASPVTSRRRSTRTARGRRPATAGCWSAMPSASSIRSIRPACCWRSKSGQLAADAIAEGLAKGDTSAAQLGKWGRDFNQRHGPHAAAGLRVLRRLQLRPVRQELSAAQGPSDRPADRRPVQGQGRRSHRPDGLDQGPNGAYVYASLPE